ncbi:hypothetical protein SKAU_G00353160 [Synaphobranchus kaupii]|uniref:Ig-like domain-containing protein n=1 Tax=Synaphobranchus kaupii TaxID=118154 RepID=A0A9Q1EKZ7_SYNKA|nr:hypothetical protein SKAU_G00353160 [Synaphobranchus kaupii]
MSISPHAVILVLYISTIILSDATTITQEKAAVQREKERILVKCEQDGTDQQMYWYRQVHQNSLELIFFSQMDGLDTEKLLVGDRFSATRENRQRFLLNITNLQPEDSAMYFCSSSFHSAQK